MHSGVFQVAEQNFVTTHVVIINWFFQQRGRATKQQFLGFTGPADLMQAKKICTCRNGVQGTPPPLIERQVGDADFALYLYRYTAIESRRRRRGGSLVRTFAVANEFGGGYRRASSSPSRFSNKAIVRLI